MPVSIQRNHQSKTDLGRLAAQWFPVFWFSVFYFGDDLEFSVPDKQGKFRLSILISNSFEMVYSHINIESLRTPYSNWFTPQNRKDTIVYVIK